MVHPDHETRVGAHRVFSVVLVPSSVCPRSLPSIPESKKASDFPRTLSRTVSVFSSSAALFEKLRKEKFLSQENVLEDNRENFVNVGETRDINNGTLDGLKSSYSRTYSMQNSPEPLMTEEYSTNNSTKEPVRYDSFFFSFLFLFFSFCLKPGNLSFYISPSIAASFNLLAHRS